MHTLRKKM